MSEKTYTLLTLEESKNVLFTAFYEIERSRYAALGTGLSFEEFKTSMFAENNLWDSEFISKILIQKNYRIVKVKEQPLESASADDNFSSAPSNKGTVSK